MINLDKILSIDKNNLTQLQQTAEMLNNEDIAILVGILSEKDDKIRYSALLLLQNRSFFHSDVYPYWDSFSQKLKSSNSYQRTIGGLLIAANSKWDTENKLDYTLEEYFTLFDDEKPITVRQSIQALRDVIPYKEHLNEKISEKLMSIDLMLVKETMRKLILLDIIEILILIRKQKTTDKIDSYIFNALSGDLLDKKSKKFIEAIL